MDCVKNHRNVFTLGQNRFCLAMVAVLLRFRLRIGNFLKQINSSLINHSFENTTTVGDAPIGPRKTK